jgi:hypothetical protein
MDVDQYEEADQKLSSKDMPLIALDLDITSLGPLIAYMTWYAQMESRPESLFGL